MSNERHEKATEGNDSQDRRGLSFADLRGAMIDYLHGTFMLNMLAQINLDSDPDGNVAPYVIDNLKAMLKKASEMTPDEEARIKFDNMRSFLAAY